MSEVYVLEPPTQGKVILHTTHGPLDLELWSKECPKACRNFLQLSIDGYYNDTIFHRIVRNFIVQGGDPTGTGLGGESIYGDQLFPVERHPRLLFRYRGLVALAKLNDEDESKTNISENNQHKQHGSQFFITLSRTDRLNHKNTLFGKITGHSLYNLLSLADVPVDPKTDRPINPPKINYIQICLSPFEELIPREGSKAFLAINEKHKIVETAAIQKNEKTSQRKTLSTKKIHLLSFDVEETQSNTKDQEYGTQQDNITKNEEKDALDLAKKELKAKVSQYLPSEDGAANIENEFIQNKLSFDYTTDESKKKFQKNPEFKRHTNVQDDSENESDATDVSSVNSDEQAKAELEKKSKENLLKLRKQNQEEISIIKKDLLAFKKGHGTTFDTQSDINAVQDADLLTEYVGKTSTFLFNKKASF